MTAVDMATGDIAWQIPLGITEQLPEGKQRTGRPALAGPIVTAGGVLFVAATDDNRFRGLDAKTGRELWVTKLERRGNANPITTRGETASSTSRSSRPIRWRSTRCRDRSGAPAPHTVASTGLIGIGT